jgi:hypothetical protein
MIRLRQSGWAPLRITLAGGLVLGLAAVGGQAIITNLVLVDSMHEPQAEHVDQAELLALVQGNRSEEAFEEAFEDGDELFETVFNALDGVGAQVGDGQRFTRVPRADLAGTGQWARHLPARATGPNAQACNACHNLPFDDGAGPASANVHRDPRRSGIVASFIQRNTPHLFALGAVQRLAEEMTTALHAIRDGVVAAACADSRQSVKSARLVAKGLRFGTIAAQRSSRGDRPCPAPFGRFRAQLLTDRVTGVDRDLVVKPFQWKGSVRSVREFNRDAAHGELGMQAVEIVGDGLDGDFDGVVDEMTVGDQTALAVYLSAQPRPTTRVELASLGLIDPLPAAEITAIQHGANLFRAVACDSCHVPQLKIDDPVFSEPSQHAAYRDRRFPAGQDPVARGVDPMFPVTFDLTLDQPDNVIRNGAGAVVYRLGSLSTDPDGRATVELFGDLRRHDMGPGLAERVDEVGTGAAVFLTENLWGVGSTAPYLHDGRATTLTEAILEHGGEAAASRGAFVALSSVDQRDIIAFLDNLVLLKLAEPE